MIYIFVVMTALTVNIDNKKSEKAVKAVLDALGLSYNVESGATKAQRALTKSEEKIYKRLKHSLQQFNYIRKERSS